tara:strand:- start:197 stop:319 length:123 start_codon:yes stop_codon:yes gene_type:complete
MEKYLWNKLKNFSLRKKFFFDEFLKNDFFKKSANSKKILK